MASSDPPAAPFTIEDAIELVKDGRSWRQFAQVQTMLLGAGVELDDETMDRLSGAFLDGREKTLAEYAKAIRESIGAAPLALESEPDGEKLRDWAGTFHPDRLGYRSWGFHESDVEMVIGKFASQDDPIAAGYRYTTCLEILRDESKRDDVLAPIASEPIAAATLEAELGKHLREVHEVARQVAQLDIVSGDSETIVFNEEHMSARLERQEREQAEEMTALDSWFASHVERLGENGKALAAKVRADGKALWRGEPERTWSLFDHWLPSGEPAVRSPKAGRNLARVLWRDVVGPRLLRGRKNPPATTRTVALDVLDLYSRRYEPRTQNGQQALVFPEQRGWVLVPSLFDGALSSILERGVSLLSSEIGIDLLEWQVTEAHRQFVAQDSDFRHIAIEGGWSALAHEKLGLTSKRAPEMVRSIVLAQAHLRFESTGIRGNLLSYAEPRKHAPGQRSLVTLTLGDMLLAGFTHTLREELGATSVSAREARRLVPVLGKEALIGKNNDHAAKRRMVWRFAIALRDRAEELAQHGHVTLPVESWARLATEAGAPHTGNFLARVQTAWEHGDEKASVPPLMVRVKGERDRYTLHESRKAALEFIIEGGKLTRRKRAEGTASARARAAGRRKGAKTS